MTREQIEKKAKEEYPDEPLCSDEYTRKMRQSFIELFRKCFIKGAEFALSHQWVSVEDELPEEDTSVIAVTWDLSVLVTRFIDGKFMFSQLWEASEVTHWMPIPPLSEEGGEK